MCKVHTETMYVRCGHAYFGQMMENDILCINIDRYTMATNSRSLCPWCLNPSSAERIVDDVGNAILDWKRRLEEWKASYQAYSHMPELLNYYNAIQDGRWTPEYFMTDRCDVTKPDMQVVPPGMDP